MSHEGIRILSEDQARRESALQDTPLPHDAVTPRKVRVLKSEGTGVSIDWQDDHHSSWNFTWLRHACPCAVCNEERQNADRPAGVPPPSPSGPLVLYQAPPRPLDVTQVGRYALRFRWNDGHEAGIYSWDYLRRNCQCGSCTAARQNL